MSPDRKPICCRTRSDWLTISAPPMRAVPLVGFKMVASSRRVVVFPAPFGPRRPKISPLFTSKVTPSRACTVPRFLSWNDLARSCTSIMPVILWLSYQGTMRLATEYEHHIKLLVRRGRDHEDVNLSTAFLAYESRDL